MRKRIHIIRRGGSYEATVDGVLWLLMKVRENETEYRWVLESPEIGAGEHYFRTKSDAIVWLRKGESKS